MLATASPFADPSLWGPLTPASGPRLHHLVRLSGPFPFATSRRIHLLFLPTAASGRIGGVGRPAPLLPGELLLLLGPQPAAPVWQGATGVLLLIGDAPLRAVMEALGGGPLPGGAVLRSRDPLLTHLVLGLAEATGRGDREAITAPLGDALVARLADAVLARLPAPGTDAGGLAPWRLRRVKAFAAQHLGRTIRLAELAAVAGLSVFHFSRAFKQSTGHAPQAWLMRLRLERAQELLADGSVTLIDAAFEAGFCSHAHLTATFRRVLGTTPSAWRAQALDGGATGRAAARGQARAANDAG